MKIILVSFFSFLLMSCNDNMGLFTESKTKTEAKERSSYVCSYLPSKTKFKLLTGSILEIDTAWAEQSCYRKNGKIYIDSNTGYNLTFNYKVDTIWTFPFFDFSICDSSNRMFGSGIDYKYKSVNPKKLYDTMFLYLSQKNSDSTIGWKKEIITDTIFFTKIR